MKQVKKRSGSIKSRTEWKRLIEEWLILRGPIAKFCHDRNLTHSSFYYWRAKFDPNYKPQKADKKKEADLGTHRMFMPIEIESEKLGSKVILHYPNGCSIEFNEALTPRFLQWLNEGMGLC